jgi:hypothetical protein
MLPWLLGLASARVYHKALAWMGIDLEEFHSWAEGHCPCGLLSDDDDEDEEFFTA